ADVEGTRRGGIREGDRGARARSAEGHEPRRGPRRRDRTRRGERPPRKTRSLEGYDPPGRERARRAVRRGAGPRCVRDRGRAWGGDVPSRRARRGDVDHRANVRSAGNRQRNRTTRMIRAVQFYLAGCWLPTERQRHTKVPPTSWCGTAPGSPTEKATVRLCSA